MFGTDQAHNGLARAKCAGIHYAEWIVRLVSRPNPLNFYIWDQSQFLREGVLQDPLVEGL